MLIKYSLAYCELYFTVSALVLRVLPRMKLFETTQADVKYAGDLFVPRPIRGTKGVRVIID